MKMPPIWCLRLKRKYARSRLVSSLATTSASRTVKPPVGSRVQQRHVLRRVQAVVVVGRLGRDGARRRGVQLRERQAGEEEEQAVQIQKCREIDEHPLDDEHDAGGEKQSREV